ncbi:serine protease [Streptomyces sp. NPDC057705]|uniref:serine protease n=1 Tax=Streptomyces sp. NPDC057705 TaxID=3346222 RepID=UPI0036B2DD42
MPETGSRTAPEGEGCVPGRSPQGVERNGARPSDPPPGSAPEETPGRAPVPTRTDEASRPARSSTAEVTACRPGPSRTTPSAPPPAEATPAERRSHAGRAAQGSALPEPPVPTRTTPPAPAPAPAPAPGEATPAERRSRAAEETAAPAGAPGIAEHLAHVVARAGRPLLVVLDAPEEMPPELAHRLGPWSEATAGWLRGTGARLVVAARPEYWERAGALYPPEALHTPARPARRLPPALALGDLTAAEAETVRARLGIPADAVAAADARHPLTLSLLAGIRAAGVTAGRPGRDEVFAAHLDLLCLRTAVRVAAACADAGGARVHGPGVRRLAARVAGSVHEAARRCLGPGQGQLDRASFEELFPWRTGWASAVLTEGLLVPAGTGYRFAHEELSDWIQAVHLDVPTALAFLVHGPAGPRLPVPRHRIGPVLEALCRLPEEHLRGELTALVHRLNRFAEEPAQADPDRAWWAARLLRESLLRTPDAYPHLPVLHALAEHVARAGPGEFGGWFWNRLRLPEPDRLDLLRRLLPADPAEAAPGDRYLDAAARRLARDPQHAQPLLCAWFADGRRLRGRPGATVATAAQALLHTHRRLAVDDLTEALVTAAHPRADELLAVLAEEEPSAMCRAVDRWAHDERPGRRVAAAAYGLATAPHVRTPADRELLRYAAQALLARPADATLHGSALAVLLRDPQMRGRYLPEALACFRDPELGSRLPAAALVAALPVLPDPDAVFAALRARADGEVVRALAALTTPGLARRAGDLVREHLAHRPGDAPHAAVFVERRLQQGPAAAPVLRPLVLDLLRNAPAGVRAELAAVLAAPGGECSYPLRGELAGVLLREEADPQVLGAFLGGLAAGTGGRPEARTRELLRRTGRQLLRVPGGPAVFERRTVELARAEPAFGALVARWLAEAPAEAAALLGPSARRTVETLGRTAPDVT